MTNRFKRLQLLGCLLLGQVMVGGLLESSLLSAQSVVVWLQEKAPGELFRGVSRRQLVSALDGEPTAGGDTLTIPREWQLSEETLLRLQNDAWAMLRVGQGVVHEVVRLPASQPVVAVASRFEAADLCYSRLTFWTMEGDPHPTVALPRVALADFLTPEALRQNPLQARWVETLTDPLPLLWRLEWAEHPLLRVEVHPETLFSEEEALTLRSLLQTSSLSWQWQNGSWVPIR